ncbi:MAG: anti-sigma-I factor RsgI family protein [Candidatus Izemoplasmataceae bacterium]
MKNKKFKQELKTMFTDETPDVLSKIKQDPRFRVPVQEKRSIFDVFKQTRFSYVFSSIFVLGILVIGMLLTQNTTTEVIASTITIDINPSVELLLNEDDEIVEINAINEDAEALIDDQEHYKGMNIDTAIRNLIQNAINQGYIVNEDNYILVNVVSENADKKALVQEKLENAFARESMRHNQPFDVRNMVRELTENAKETAQNMRLSGAKYELIQTILEASDTNTFEELQNKSIRELFGILNEQNGDESNFPPMGPREDMPGPNGR